jgi:hypothetical protein
MTRQENQGSAGQIRFISMAFICRDMRICVSNRQGKTGRLPIIRTARYAGHQGHHDSIKKINTTSITSNHHHNYITIPRKTSVSRHFTSKYIIATSFFITSSKRINPS